MSELIRARQYIAIRKQCLATASALALVAYIASTHTSNAEDSHPTVWLELGGQMEAVQGSTDPFTAPFMAKAPAPYDESWFLHNQRPPLNALGLEGSIMLQPQGSDWAFSANIRYGRAQTNRHAHHQTKLPPEVVNFTFYGYSYQSTFDFHDSPFGDVKAQHEQSHLVLDFQAGRDVGLGAFGAHGQSRINVGVRFAQFSAKSTVNIYARPVVHEKTVPFIYGLPFPIETFYQYTASGHSQRSFRGIGPSLSWSASADLIGDPDRSEVTFDWGLNAALLFGRQKAKTDHVTQAYYLTAHNRYQNYVQPYPARQSHSTRSRSVTVPNVGGFAGVSLRFPNAKMSLGYRADFFLGAEDSGIDVRRTTDLGFHGPFATISIGFGG